MAKILIVYQSKTGNTERMSEAVEAGVRSEGVNVTRKKIRYLIIPRAMKAEGTRWI